MVVPNATIRALLLTESGVEVMFEGLGPQRPEDSAGESIEVEDPRLIKALFDDKVVVRCEDLHARGRDGRLSWSLPEPCSDGTASWFGASGPTVIGDRADHHSVGTP